MLLDVIGWGYGILAIVFFIYAVIWNIRRLYYAIKCRKTKQCKWQGCCFSVYCDKYIYVPTEKEIQLLSDLLAEFKNQQLLNPSHKFNE